MRSLLRKAIQRGSAVVPRPRTGPAQSGSARLARPALRDHARVVRDWADKLLKQAPGKPGRKAVSPRHGPPSKDE